MLVRREAGSGKREALNIPLRSAWECYRWLCCPRYHLCMRKLQSLDAWRLAQEVARNAYSLTMGAPLRSHYALSDQIRRAASSIPANICEGYSLGTRAQLIRFVRIALGSASELKCHLELARDLKLAPTSQSEELIRETSRLLSVLIGFLKHLGARVPT